MLVLMKLVFSRQIFEKCSNIKYHEHASSGSRIVPCGYTDGRTDMTKLIVTFRNFKSAPKNFANTKMLQQSDSVSKKSLVVFETINIIFMFEFPCIIS